MKFSDLWEGPIAIQTAPFKKREGQPYLQGVARNYGHAIFGKPFGDDNAYAFEQKYLGDTADGRRYAAGGDAGMGSAGSFTSLMGGSANPGSDASAQALSGTPFIPQRKSPNGQSSADDILAQWAQVAAMGQSPV